MGKSPAKWIKTVLFGKKTTKTNLSKNATTERKVSSDGKGPAGILAADSIAATDVPAQITHESGENTVLERGTSTNLSVDATLVHGEQGSDIATGQSNLANSADIVRLEEAATKAQAAFRGYLARRAFKALKGIIRLQALIRGHLVRRQAVSTLRSMHAIVKFQALVRGRQVRLSDAGREVIRSLKSGESMECKRMDMIAFVTSGKLSRNSFVNKLVASFPTVMPLSLQYDMVDPNSVWSWLERWSSSHFWEPLARPKKHINSKRQRRQVNAQTSERDSGKAKRSSQRGPPLNGTEHEKPKRSQRKVPGHQAEPIQDQPQSELERVKRSLKKVSTMIEEASEKAEVVTEKPSMKRPSNPPAPDVAVEVIDTPSQIVTESVTISEQLVMEEALPKPLETDEPINTSAVDDHLAVDSFNLENGGDKVSNSDKLNEELSPKEDQAKENQKTRRRKSLPVKQEYSENVSQNTPSRPSYMQATESAKAKLRAQASPKFGEDEGENGFVRRHSLPSSTNGKPSLLSPRIQKPLVHSNGKGGSKSDKSLLSSRDGNDKGQPGWRR